jgi:hypothetical protein
MRNGLKFVLAFLEREFVNHRLNSSEVGRGSAHVATFARWQCVIGTPNFTGDAFPAISRRMRCP